MHFHTLYFVVDIFHFALLVCCRKILGYTNILYAGSQHTAHFITKHRIPLLGMLHNVVASITAHLYGNFNAYHQLPTCIRVARLNLFICFMVLGKCLRNKERMHAEKTNFLNAHKYHIISSSSIQTKNSQNSDKWASDERYEQWWYMIHNVNASFYATFTTFHCLLLLPHTMPGHLTWWLMDVNIQVLCITL